VPFSQLHLHLHLCTVWAPDGYTPAGAVITKPPNLHGDRCDSGQVFCGYWYHNGWQDDDMSLPDLEDWTLTHYGNGAGDGDGGAGTPPFWRSCMFLEL